MNFLTRNALLRKLASKMIGFDEGREFRISLELSIPTATPLVLKFFAPIDFDLTLQTLSCDEQAIKFEAFRAGQGAEGGTFSDIVPIYGNNIQSTAGDYTGQIAITSGGTFTPNGDATGVPVEIIRLKTSSATAQRTTVGGDITGERGLPANTYYLKLTNYGSGTATGVYTLIWQENP